ncbi:acyl transferase/acyl hydrolase/lysophospholipase [Dunaliella salina]|uniref:Acyl transferase/acyl hydrolase/lysophospholipase n=1 Tax=Dunaliella salina TaxID=3046 RepID=A0ABQ7GKF4_DUNSA|nr:acyl transferase/acyl hydrolase/lysophospholipase [Dunaliella salina]|eukprot:KAF5835064.1 acyl transferase/acyl hydrolase/lysophospholipase [Dunaliella salina]
MQQVLRNSQRVSLAAGPLATSKGSSRGVVRVHASADTDFASYKPNVAAFFPGQGAQTVGMAKELVAEVPAAKDMFNKASDILGYDLLQLCTEGPKDRLDSTEISQPAIYVASLAAVEKLRATEGQGQVGANASTKVLKLESIDDLWDSPPGCSVCWVHIIFEDGLRLVKLRGESMQAAANAAASGMVSVIGLDSGKVAELCKAASAEVGKENAVRIANYLCPGNYAVSGSKEGCDAVERLGKPNYKARMTVRLAVAGAFHTDFMQPAVEKLQAALAQTEVKKPRIPVISNVDAQPHSDPETIKSILARQVTSPVLWENTLMTLFEKGLTRSYEIGPGKVVAGITKRINKEHNITNIFA